VGARPTLEINGIQGGFTGTGVKTVLPHKAFAKISCRLVAQQEPQRIFECIRDHIRAITPPTVRSELIRQEPGARAVLLDRKSRAMQAASAAYEFAWGTKAVFERAGATLPIASQMQKIVSEIVLMGFGFKSGIAHGPNENIHVLSFHRGVSAAIYFLQEIAKSAE
jgi:acetylornithine deacetylase/succinyl-diaminopimelate desuccinylase-like protein